MARLSPTAMGGSRALKPVRNSTSYMASGSPRAKRMSIGDGSKEMT